MPLNVKIQELRDQLELTQAELGARIGITRQTLAAWEKGEREPTLVQVSKLARAMQVPIELLLDLEPAETVAEPTLLFRADDPQVLSDALRALLTHRAEDYAQIEQLATELPVLPESRPLEGYDFFQVEQVAREVRDWLGVEDAPLGDVLGLLEARGLKVILLPLPNAISGFSAYTERWGGVIFVNRTHPLERRTFTALHELAHLIFHRREYDGPTPKVTRADPREKAANHLASAVLLPREVMERELHAFALSWLPEPVLVDLRLRYGVSMRTVLLRAGALGMISKHQAGQQVGVLNKRFGKEPENPPLPEPEGAQGRLERLTYRALVNERITTSRAAEVLGWSLSAVRRRLAEYLRNPAVESQGPRV